MNLTEWNWLKPFCLEDISKSDAEGNGTHVAVDTAQSAVVSIYQHQHTHQHQLQFQLRHGTQQHQHWQ